MYYVTSRYFFFYENRKHIASVPMYKSSGLMRSLLYNEEGLDAPRGPGRENYPRQPLSGQ